MPALQPKAGNAYPSVASRAARREANPDRYRSEHVPTHSTYEPSKGTTMRRKFGYSIAAAAMIGGISLGTAGPALADHCLDSGGPGNSDSPPT